MLQETWKHRKGRWLSLYAALNSMRSKEQKQDQADTWGYKSQETSQDDGAVLNEEMKSRNRSIFAFECM